ncbi:MULTISPECIES: SMI1/KNR4 family protein [unclassified Streptomyces]|uniref:SMI1/KNR4 family protein n=1 Tax=unclassified Streptomyces TaxID=2593676 RepID=UPI00069B7921|nr:MULTISPECIES: SMI1/KNR4 family protein [unclassified Streptomyces]AZM45159.1 SMI1/KNR4 family protein [Streptomyces sp. WAC 06738]
MAGSDDVQPAFWDTSSNYGVQRPLTDQDVQEAEQLLDVTLPTSLLDLLRAQNGGQVTGTRNAFRTDKPTSWSEDHIPFDHLMGIGHRERAVSLLDSPYLVEEWDLPSPLVLLSGDGHYWIALDYRACGRHGEPSVAWFDADFSVELALAPDFGSFVEGLSSSSDFD